MTRETESLLCEVLIELFKFLKHKNREREREEFERELAENRAKHWGYPTRRRRGGR